jgi:acyl-CoA thioester hydrolase
VTATATAAGAGAGGFRLPVRVYYQDTDAGGVVFHGAYLNFLERARTEFLRVLGFDIGRLAADGVLFVLHRVEIEFLKPAVLDEALTITAAIARLGRTSAQFAQTVERADGSCAVRASLALVCVSAAKFKPVAIPEPLRDALQPFVLPAAVSTPVAAAPGQPDGAVPSR